MEERNFYALVFYPELNSEVVDELRQKYDPYYELIKEHITLVFPLPDTPGEEKIVSHIRNVIEKWHPFKVSVSGYEKTWDHWLYLKVKEGKDDLIKLHDQLYTGILELYLRKDLPYKPHIGIGLFTEERYDPLHPEKLTFDKEAYEKALIRLDEAELSFQRIMNQLTLVKISENFSGLTGVETFYLA